MIFTNEPPLIALGSKDHAPPSELKDVCELAATACLRHEFLKFYSFLGLDKPSFCGANWELARWKPFLAVFMRTELGPG